MFRAPCSELKTACHDEARSTLPEAAYGIDEIPAIATAGAERCQTIPPAPSSRSIR